MNRTNEFIKILMDSLTREIRLLNLNDCKESKVFISAFQSCILELSGGNRFLKETQESSKGCRYVFTSKSKLKSGEKCGKKTQNDTDYCSAHNKTVQAFMSEPDFNLNSSKLLMTCCEALEINIDRVRCLLSKGADPNFKDDDQITPLYLTTYSEENIEVTEMLLLLGVDPNTRCCSIGNTALFPACVNDNVETVRLLLKHKADPNIKNNKGETVIDYALEKGNQTMIDLFYRYPEHL